MPRRKDLTGKRIGRWTVLGFIGAHPKQGDAMWLCRCECGTERVRSSRHFRSGSRSCGCTHTKHGHMRRTNGVAVGSPTYRSWQGMIMRCHNPQRKCFEYYGARGITVCEQWHDFKNFLSDMGQRPEGLSLERINNDGNYEPNNCKWATRLEQTNNKRGNVVICRANRSMTVSQWADHLGMDKLKWRQVKKTVEAM